MKYYFGLIAIAVLWAAVAWTFNHIDPWIAIFVMVIAIGVSVKLTINFIKKITKDKQ